MSTPQFIVEGGRPLAGAIAPTGNKNAALPIVCAALLTSEPVTLENVPRIRDIESLLSLVRAAGASADWTGPNTLVIHAKSVRGDTLPPELCARIRASILLAGPLLARCGEVTLAPPGGDVIGRRRLDTHVLALEALGATHDFGERIVFRAKQLKGADIFLDEPSVTGTENAVMAAVAAKGTTTLHNAACEPHVQDLCEMLIAIGARIEGIGSNLLTIEGGRPLRGGRFRIGPDHIEVGSFIGLAAVTRSRLVIEDAGIQHLRSIRLGFDRLGVRTEVQGKHLVVPAEQELRIKSDLGGAVPKLEDQPWPAFPADVMSIAIVTATQCEGIILIHEKMFESRLFFVDKLVGMGARIVLCDPHRALVSGPTQLRGAQVESPDIRAGMAMLIAALCAKGTSVIQNIGQIERGYERIDERLNALGASIRRVQD
ncbi:MAG: UDP-N-acetylglucosamine 1-carboxyvinyltransferase [Gemmatimonadaceae bacterium]|nr:UDP-N-acetylglucosamine 1-carboxyvinyltransferase [Gemmatimonadaceae bacterium]MCW5825055.1 UDP-N-acetylglucosamine 1-carboxyvinyltransferase [Gemmatimonadaceae bacterium]